MRARCVTLAGSAAAAAVLLALTACGQPTATGDTVVRPQSVPVSAAAEQALPTGVDARVASAGPTTADEELNWQPLSELGRRDRSYVILDEEENSEDVNVALTRLSDATPIGQTDAMFIFRQTPIHSCGSGGCALQLLLEQPDGTLAEVWSVSTDDVALDRSSTNGMRNLRLAGGAATWVWNGKTYDIK